MAYIDEKNETENKPFSRFMKGYPNKNTSEVYKYDLRCLLDWFVGEKEGTDDERAQKFIDAMTSGKFKLSDVLTDYMNFLKTKKYSPLVINNRLTIVKKFLVANDVNIVGKVNGKVPAREAQNNEDSVNKDQIKEILTYAPPMLKTIIYIAVSSGMRIGEILKMNPDWLSEVGESIVKVDIPADATKTGQRRTTFLNEETSTVLREWIKYRSTWISKIKTMDKEEKEELSNRPEYFPVSRSNVERMFVTVLKKAQLNVKANNGKYKIHLHVFRKYFRTQLVKGGQNALDYVESFMGHSGYLSKSYLRLTIEDKIEWYTSNNYLLNISDVLTVESEETRQKMNEYENRIKLLESIIANLPAANMLISAVKIAGTA